MTMTSVAVVPVSLGASPAMFTPKMYHLQQGINSTGASANPGKSNYDTLSKNKKSWSVRLGLSRQNQNSDDPGKVWGTISGSSPLSRQMVYGDPWLYGTVRSSTRYAGVQEPRGGFLTPPPPPPLGTSVLVVCSCPEFLSGTTRKYGSNCRKCGGHRLAGVPLGGTCRLPQSSSRSRPSLAGVLRTSIDDPYDLMRRSRLVEPRPRTRSISPALRPSSSQRGDSVRSQSVSRNVKELHHCRGSIESTSVRSIEWYDKEPPAPPTTTNYDDTTTIPTKSRTNSNGASSDSSWLTTEDTNPNKMINHHRNSPTALSGQRLMQRGTNKSKTITKDSLEGTNNNCSHSNNNNNNNHNNNNSNRKDGGTSSSAIDIRKSILECDVNPYLLLRKPKVNNKDEDDLSDDLSDNALEQDGTKLSQSSLFDPSKVKSIERIPNRSAFAAIGGQRIKVFNEPTRELSDDEEMLPVTRIPIPKVSPKRPPRRLKEAKQTLKSILKRGKMLESKRKKVLFNVDNIIFAPEKPPEIIRSTWNRIDPPEVKKSPPPLPPTQQQQQQQSQIQSQKLESKRKEFQEEEKEEAEEEQPIVPQEKKAQQQRVKPRFITIPNIRDPKDDRIRINEPKIVPRVKTPPPNNHERFNMDKLLSKTNSPKSSTSEESVVPKKKDDTEVTTPSPSTTLMEEPVTEKSISPITTQDPILVSTEDNDHLKDIGNILPEDETELEIVIEELKNRLSGIAVDEKDLILKSEAENSKRSSVLCRSQSERACSRTEQGISAGEVIFTDTMRLSYCKKDKNSPVSFSKPKKPKEEEKENESSIKIDEKEMSKEINKKSQIAETKVEEPSRSLPVDLRNKEIPEYLKGEHFRRMRPTSCSPPPGRQKHRFRISDPGISNEHFEQQRYKTLAHQEHRRTVSSASSNGSSKIEINSFVTLNHNNHNNVCKINVTPDSTSCPLVHRLQVSQEMPIGSRRTSIMINGDENLNSPTESVQPIDNRVTISVGGEDSVCNPTVISVNSDNPPNIPTPVKENRTLVILENYKSNIVIESKKSEDHPPLDGEYNKSMENSSTNQKIVEEESSNDATKKSDPQDSETITNVNFSKCNSNLSKEELISKLLEDSLRKARENGEILDEDSGEAILKILKQSLLKSKEHENSEANEMIEASYSGRNMRDTDFVNGTDFLLEENPYEIIKEPIYEEIPDEPPPLPLSPPPTEDYIKERLYFHNASSDYYRKGSDQQYILNSSYLSSDSPSNSPNKNPINSYLSKSQEFSFKTLSTSPPEENISTKFELLNYLMDSKNRSVSNGVEDEEEDDEEEEEEEEDDTEGDLEALYEQKETSLGDLSSKSSQISNVSDSSEECNIILTNSPEMPKSRVVDIERTDSGVGSESSQASSSRGMVRRWRTGNHVPSGLGNLLDEMPQVTSGETKLCEDCEQRLDPLITDSGVVYAPFVCRKCSKKRAERKEIISEIVETEQKYGRDLQIILEEFHRPMLRAGLLTSEQLSAIFLNVEELLEHNMVLAEKLKDAVELAQESGDEDLLTVDVGKIFLESERMLHAFEHYCTRQGSASLLLQNLEKEKELLRIFLKVSQMENTVLRRMNLNSFLMVPVQRVTKYPLLLARLLKATPSFRSDIQEAKKRLKQAQTNIELHLEHMNAEAKDVTSTKLWRRISIIQNGRRPIGEQDMVNIKLRKMAVEVLEWAHEEARFVLEGRLLVAQPTDNNWRRGRTVKLAPVTAMLVTNGKSNAKHPEVINDSLFPRYTGIKEATLLLVKEKIGRYSLLREPLYLDKCIVCCETDLEDYFEIQELSSKETFIFKAEDDARTKRWCRTLQTHAQSLGAWRKRRGALPNIMICGVARS